MSDDKKTTIVDGVEWEEQGPYCIICNAHMGDYYNEEGVPVEGEEYPNHFINPHGYEDFDSNTCPNCGQEYQYIEGDSIVLTDTQLEVLRGQQ